MNKDDAEYIASMAVLDHLSNCVEVRKQKKIQMLRQLEKNLTPKINKMQEKQLIEWQNRKASKSFL